MDFNFSEDQILLADSVARYLAKEYDFGKRRKIMDAGGFSQKAWKDFAELGWLAAPFPEELGGLGGSAVETLIIMEQFGRHLVLEPFLSTVVLGGRLIAQGMKGAARDALIGEIIAGQLRLALAATEIGSGASLGFVETRAEKAGVGFVLSGEKPVVANAPVAQKLIVSARTSGAPGDAKGITLFLVDHDAKGVSLTPFRSHDGTSAADIALDRVSVGADAILGEIDNALPLLEEARDHGIAAISAEAMGSLAYLVPQTAEHIKTRQQYGSPLSRFQVLQHRMADMYVASELARSMAYYAAVSLARPAPARMAALSQAKVQIIRAAQLVGAQAVQLHGGMGMSEELDVAHHFKRLTMIGLQFGDEGFHLRRLATLAAAAA